jgi:predicted PurR-regulated permease PerM
MRQSIQTTAFGLVILVLSLLVLIHASSFFVPLAFAAVLAMLLTPLAGWLEGKHWPPSLSAFACVLVILFVIAIITLFVRWQLGNLLDNTDQIEQELGRRYQELRKFIADSFGISLKEQEKIINEQGGSAGKSASSMITATVSGIGSFLTQFLLTLVYVFLFVYFRKKLHQFALEIAPPAKRDTVDDALENSRKVAQHYLGGLALMVMLLWVMYGIGFYISGVRNALFFAVLCGLLEIIPFIGNLTGTAITLLMVLAQGGSTGTLLGVVITYAVVQFVQSYLIEPLVVGKGVSINPLFTILGLVAGEFIWGIPGMVLALPAVGIMKVIFDHIGPLKPLGKLMGDTGKGQAKRKNEA